jgi:hypothetical protein
MVKDMFRMRGRTPLPSLSAAGLLVGGFLLDLEHRLLRNRPPAVAVVEELRMDRRRSTRGLMLTDAAPALEPREVPDRSGARL